MFKFKDILAIILGVRHFFVWDLFFGLPFHFYEGRSNRDYLDHLLPLKSPRIPDELADQ